VHKKISYFLRSQIKKFTNFKKKTPPIMAEEKTDMSSLLEVNRLDYRLSPSLSIATSRAMKSYRSHEGSYKMGTDQIQFTLSSGATYVDFLNSYVRFTVELPAGLAGTLAPKLPAHTGWASIIRSIRVVHSSGVELDRQQETVGEWIQLMDYYNCSKEERQTTGSLYSLNDTMRPSALIARTGKLEKLKEGLNLVPANPPTQAEPGGDYVTALAEDAWEVEEDPSGKKVEVAIPLAKLLGFFNSDLLAPSFLCAGLQIYIDTHTPQHFFICGTDESGLPAGGGNWLDQEVKISNCEVELETFTLVDSVIRKLSQISASSGLEWSWDAVHEMNITVNSSDLTMQITRALSRANNITVRTRLAANIGNTAADSFASQPWVPQAGEIDYYVGAASDTPRDGRLSQFQCQLGAQYIPSRSILSNREFMHSALKTFSQFRRDDKCVGVTEDEFTGIPAARPASASASAWYSGLAIASLPLESSSTLQQSGAAISAQRTANVNMQWANANNRRVDMYVTYSKLASLFLDSVVVRS